MEGIFLQPLKKVGQHESKETQGASVLSSQKKLASKTKHKDNLHPLIWDCWMLWIHMSYVMFKIEMEMQLSSAAVKQS